MTKTTAHQQDALHSGIIKELPCGTPPLTADRHGGYEIHAEGRTFGRTVMIAKER